jgi:xylulokinase
MALYIGGDVGTSALKLVLLDEKGMLVRSVNEEYPLSFPHPGWSEQNPEDWWKAFVKGLADLVRPEERHLVKGISLDGQMHGLVALDKDGKVLRPAILWNDERTEEEVLYLNDQIGKEFLLANTGNIAYAGFTAPKLLWMKKNEPDLFCRIAHILLPKDYLVYRLTGRLSTDYSDAAGTLLLDVKNRKWSQKMLSVCGLTSSLLPQIHESQDIVGNVGKDVRQLLKLPEDVFVLAGAADNAAAALGVGAVSSGDCNISLGTSGTIFMATDKFAYDPNGTIHAFNSANKSYCLLACMLSAASCLKWLNDSILKIKDYNQEQALIAPSDLGHNPVYFLPYLMGERSPLNDPAARGLFIGLSMDTRRQDLTQAVLEGVSFALKDSLVAAQKMGLTIAKSYLTGGGSKSPLWRQMLADILDIRLKIIGDEYGPAYGMGMLALVADGIYPDLKAARDSLIKVKEVIVPNRKTSALYQTRYESFAKIYPTVKSLYRELK